MEGEGEDGDGKYEDDFEPNAAQEESNRLKQPPAESAKSKKESEYSSKKPKGSDESSSEDERFMGINELKKRREA